MKIQVVNNYHDAQKRAAIFYDRIRHVISPVLGGESVVFDKIGFHHLMKKGRNPRPKSEQMRRFKLLQQHAIGMLKNPSAEVVLDHGRINGIPVYYWAFKEKRDSLLVTLVVRKLGRGKKHFLSIYAKKAKTAQ